MIRVFFETFLKRARFRDADVSRGVEFGLVILQKHLRAIRIYLSKCRHDCQGDYTGREHERNPNAGSHGVTDLKMRLRPPQMPPG